MMMVVVCVAFGQTNNLQQIWTASQIISEFFYFSHCIFLSNFCEIAFAVCTHRYFEMQFSFTSDEIVLQFLGVVRISPWSNSTVTLFCTYQSTDYGRVIGAFFQNILNVFSNWADVGQGDRCDRVTPKFSDTLTLSQPVGADSADSAHHHRGRT